MARPEKRKRKRTPKPLESVRWDGDADPYEIGYATPADYARIVEIMGAVHGAAGLQDLALSLAVFRRMMAQPDMICRVARVEVGVVGFALCQFGDDEILIHDLAVDPEHRGKSMGHTMLVAIIAGFHAGRRRRITAMIPDRAPYANLTFRGAGFRATGVVRGEFGRPDQYRFTYVRPPGKDA